MKVYIAAPFFNPQQLATVEKIEQQLDKEQILYYSPRSEGILQDMNPSEQKLSKTVIYNTNVQAMDDCTHMIAWIDDRDTGTIFEVGYFAGVQKEIVLFVHDTSKISVMLAEAAIAVCDDLYKLKLALQGEYSVEPGEVN